MKLAKTLLTPPLVAISVALCAALSSFGATCTFNGAWDTAPAAGDDIVVTDGTLTWTAAMPHQVASWTQSGGTVTIETTYNDTFPKLEVTGNVVLEGGTWTHKANANMNRTYRLFVSVGGNMTVGSAAVVKADELGYDKAYMVNGGKIPTWFYCGSYGGLLGDSSGAGAKPSDSGILPYGSITAPEDLGCGGYSYKGGGAIRLDVSGTLTVDGLVSANSQGLYYIGSGGSVYIHAGQIAGSGQVTANCVLTKGNANRATGSGGRIAIILTGEDADFSSFDPVTQCSACTALSVALTENQTMVGAPGTIYAETPADVPDHGWLIFRDVTELNGKSVRHKFAESNANPFYGTDALTASSYARITLVGGAKIVVGEGRTFDARVLPIEIADETPQGSGFELAGGTFYPAGSGVNYAIRATVGMDGLKADTLHFLAGSSLTVDGQPATFDGDLTVDEGVTVMDNAGLAVSGDMVLNGTITRTGPFAEDPPPIALSVGGDLTIGATGLIDGTGLGYAASTSPLGTGAAAEYFGAAYGGKGSSATFLPYGSIVNPTTAGAGGFAATGGACIMLAVGGEFTHNGTIKSESLKAGGVNHYRGAGGAVNVTAGTISGAGRISADSGVTSQGEYGYAGGGRVAIRLTDADADFSSFTGEVSARGDYKSAKAVGGAGTVWTSTAAQGMDNGTLSVDNGPTSFASYYETPIGGAVDDGVFGDVLVGRSAKLAIKDGATLSVSGVLSNGCEFAAEEGSTVRFFGTGLSRVYGSAYEFSNLVADAPGKEIVFDDGAMITVSGAAALNGTAAENLTLCSATEGTAWTLTVPAGSTFTGVALRDCVSQTAITIVNGADLGGNSANITFVNIEPGQLVTWTGAADAAWDNAANWDCGRTPIVTDKVLVPSSAARTATLGVSVTVSELTVEAGASLALGGKKLTVTGDASFAGALICSGADELDVKGDLALAAMTPASSTVRLSGDEQTLTLNGTTLYALALANAKTVVSGDLVAASLSAGNGKDAFEVVFGAGASVKLNTMTVAGDAETKNGVLRCATAGGQWNLSVDDAHVSGVTVSGSDASKGVTVVPTDCADGGDNVNWLFVDNRTHWTGATSSDFANASNWSDGVPTAEKDAVVEGTVPCVISSAAAAGNFTVNPNAKVTVNADFTVNGSCTILSGATVTWNRPGTIAGSLVLLSGATLTHDNNTNAEVNKLNLTVGGTGYVAAGAKVTADAKGYFGACVGPGGGHYGNPQGSYGASHGGLGYAGAGSTPPPCYGSILCPTNFGSSGYLDSDYERGGGAIRLAFAGALTVDGTISANAATYNGAHYTPSGGSVWLTAASLAGAPSGVICAAGPDQSTTAGAARGGAGRVALYLTAATSLADYHGSISARGALNGAKKSYSSPGTYYLQTAADEPGAGTLLVAGLGNDQVDIDANFHRTELTPASLCAENEIEKMTVVVKDKGYASITRDAKVEDIQIPDATGRLYLNGYTLTVHRRRHALGADPAVQVIPGERTDPETGETITGKIEWLKYGTVIIFK